MADAIIDATPPSAINAWRKEDPLCKKYAWYNVLMYFAVSRAERLGLAKRVKKPQWKKCLLCRERFVEDSIPQPLVERFGVDRLYFCAPCLSSAVLSAGNMSLSREGVLRYIRRLTRAIEAIPCQGFGDSKDDFLLMSDAERLRVLKVLRAKPTSDRVKQLFSTWLNALVEAGVLEGDVRRTKRGIQCIAKDGHACLSLGEKTIDDLLFGHKIRHKKEPRYPSGNFRADFAVGNVLIEYFGLKGDDEYDEKTREKFEICKEQGVTLIAIYPEDLTSRTTLDKKLLSLRGRSYRSKSNASA